MMPCPGMNIIIVELGLSPGDILSLGGPVFGLSPTCWSSVRPVSK